MTVQSARITGSNPAHIPSMSEADLQRLVTDAASRLGWYWQHTHPLRTRDGWATPTSGSLGEGWPDLFLAHPKQRRLLAIELKAAKGTVTTEQLLTHSILVASGLEVLIVRPADIDATLRILATPPAPLPRDRRPRS